MTLTLMTLTLMTLTLMTLTLMTLLHHKTQKKTKNTGKTAEKRGL